MPPIHDHGDNLSIATTIAFRSAQRTYKRRKTNFAQGQAAVMPPEDASVDIVSLETLGTMYWSHIRNPEAAIAMARGLGNPPRK